MTHTLVTLALAVGVSGVAASMPASVAAQSIGLPLGTTPPPAKVVDLEGTAVDLAKYVGETPVLLEFWATWCPLCAALEPELAEAQRRFGDRVQFLVIGVGVNQTPESIREHLAEHPVAGRVLFDAEGAAARAYRAPTTSYIVILDGNGRVAYTGAGAEQDLVAALSRVVTDAATGNTPES